MYTNIYKTQSMPLIDLDQYEIFKKYSGLPRIARLYPSIPRKTKAIPFDIFDYDSIFNDEATKKIIREGKTIGCFYIESPGMRSLLWRLSADTFEMVTAASSIIRPGVAESGMMREFILRHKNPGLRKYLNKEMEDILGETYGVMIYQEDVIKVAHHISGLSLEDADLLRRAMSGKMRSRDAMERLKKKYFESCGKKGLDKNLALELWHQMESFAGYAFCKAHSASFALLSFQVAFLKVHYPAEFMANVLSNGGGYYSAGVYTQEAKRLGLTILLPCINESYYEYTGEGGHIRIGFLAIKNLIRTTAETIVNERKSNGKYESLLDLLVRTKIGITEAASLIQCGAMDCFKKTRPTLLRLLDIYMRLRKVLNASYTNLFMDETYLLEKEIETSIDYTVEEKCRIEYETFGYMVTRHPLEFFNGKIDYASITPAASMQNYHNKRITMVGWYMTSKRIRTKKGEIMKFLSFEDLTGTFEAVLFPKTYSKFAELTFSVGPYIITGKADAESGNNIIVDSLDVLTRKEFNLSMQKDGTDNKYYGDIEKVTEEELRMLEQIPQEKLIYAYVG